MRYPRNEMEKATWKFKEILVWQLLKVAECCLKVEILYLLFEEKAVRSHFLSVVDYKESKNVLYGHFFTWRYDEIPGLWFYMNSIGLPYPQGTFVFLKQVANITVLCPLQMNLISVLPNLLPMDSFAYCLLPISMSSSEESGSSFAQLVTNRSLAWLMVSPHSRNDNSPNVTLSLNHHAIAIKHHWRFCF